MTYSLNLSSISVKEYKDLLKRQNLLPGRRILLHDIDRCFKSLEKQGIADIAELKKQLSTPQKLANIASATGISQDYLTILKREIGSLEQKPVPIDSFPEIDKGIVENLIAQGIKTSKQYYESKENNLELLCLCDLVRINGVGAVAARAFYEAGYCSVKEVAEANAAEMLDKVTEINRKRQYYKANLGEKDMQFCIDFASLLMKYSG